VAAGGGSAWSHSLRSVYFCKSDLCRSLCIGDRPSPVAHAKRIHGMRYRREPVWRSRTLALIASQPYWVLLRTNKDTRARGMRTARLQRLAVLHRMHE